MKILVIQMKMIGDVLTSSILFEALRKEFPEAELHYLIYKHTYPVIQNNPNIDKVIFGEQGFYNIAKRVKSEKYFAVIDVYSNLKTALITKISGAKYRIAYNKWYTRPLTTHVFSRKIQAGTIAGAAIEKRMRMLSPLSSNFPAEIKPKIYLTKEEKLEAEKKLLDAGVDRSNSLFMIGALGSSNSKTYPLNYLADLLDKIVAQTNGTLLFNYMPSQKAEIDNLYNFCNSKTQSHIKIEVYGKSLREFMALTSNCDALIGNEGGAVNMAKALNVPTFAIYSPQIEKANWNMYEDGKTNISVHLRDFSEEAFKAIHAKKIKNSGQQLYKKFLPGLIWPELERFLKINSK